MIEVATRHTVRTLALLLLVKLLPTSVMNSTGRLCHLADWMADILEEPLKLAEPTQGHLILSAQGN